MPPKPATPILASLEFGRFIAASLVVLTHVLGDVPRYGLRPNETILGAIHPPTPIAVQYFFVLSGFVMMTAHQRDFGRLAALPRYWWRRACRLYPVYWLSLGIVAYYVFGALTPGLAFRLASLLPVATQELVPPAWSLRYEVAFYVMFGLCLLPFIGRAILVFWVLAVFWCWRPASMHGFLLCAPTRAFDWFSYHYAAIFFAPFDLFFFAGLLGGWVFGRFALPPGRGVPVLGAGLLVLALCGPALDWGYSYGTPLMDAVSGLGVSGVITGLAGLERARPLRRSRVARLLGAMSYPLYILHGSLMLMFSVAFGSWLRLGAAGLYALAIGGLVAIYAICAVVTFGFDQPLQRVLKGKKAVLI